MSLVLSQRIIKENAAGQILWGSVFITLCSYINIPTLPIAFTLQTFALFILALVQKPNICFFSATLYLLKATLGLPVLCGHSNPLWFLGPSGGYLIAFPLSVYVISLLAQNGSLLTQAFSIFCGQLIIYALGFLWLSSFIGYSAALKGGVLVFIPSALLKGGLAIGIVHLFRRSSCLD